MGGIQRIVCGKHIAIALGKIGHRYAFRFAPDRRNQVTVLPDFVGPVSGFGNPLILIGFQQAIGDLAQPCFLWFEDGVPGRILDQKIFFLNHQP